MLEYVSTSADGVYPTPALIIERSLPSLIVAIPATPNNVAEALSFPACFIITPGFNPVVKSLWPVTGKVVPIPIVAFLDRNSTEFFGRLLIKSFATDTSGLKNLAVPGLPILNLALRRINFISSNWLGSQVVPFWDLNKDPKYGCWLINTCSLSGKLAVDMSTSPILEIQAV